ncbi:hypothetical protein [Bacteroides acidifaciens]|uniref:hypothetical protein n=1 Tax=Bacteroides acidifaciens TaxID=85831 RepID=UPI00242FAA72|nr:hypothetical protein [Bacteroides acidifaciens]
MRDVVVGGDGYACFHFLTGEEDRGHLHVHAHEAVVVTLPAGLGLEAVFQRAVDSI